MLGILSVPDSAAWLERMDESRLLTAVFPELEASRRCAEVYYGKGGVLRHSLDAVARMDFLLAELSAIYPGHAAAIRTALGARPGGLERGQALLRLAVLLHDVAKPATARRIGGRLRFFTHEARGAEMAEAALRGLRLPPEEIDLVKTVIAQHLRPGNLAANRVISDRAVSRFFRDLGPHGPALLLLAWSDHASYLRPAALKAVLPRIYEDPTKKPRRRLSSEKGKTLYHLQVITHLLDRSLRLRRPAPPAAGLLSGHEVMEALGIPPGPEVGRSLKALAAAQRKGAVENRAEALRFIKSLIVRSKTRG